MLYAWRNCDCLVHELDGGIVRSRNRNGIVVVLIAATLLLSSCGTSNDSSGSDPELEPTAASAPEVKVLEPVPVPVLGKET